MIKQYSLGDCVSAIIDYRGKTPQKMGGDWVENGIRVISALNVHGGFIDNEDQIRCVNEDIYKKWMQIEIQRNDCFLASEGASLGENTIWDSDEKIVLGQRLYAIRTNPEILDPWYFAAYMQTKKFRQQVDQVSTGSTVFGISQPVLQGLKLQLPEIETQRAIGQFYKKIHNKIKNNNAICADLEGMAKLLYDYWFVQFDFPDENGKPYKSSGGKMVWNEELKREIPEGWEVKRLEDLCSLRNGINYDKNEYGDADFRIANVRNITASTFLMDTNDFDVIRLKKDKAKQYLLKPEDIVIARSGTPGAIRLVQNPSDNVIFCGFIICCTPTISEGRYYLAYTLKMFEGTSATKTGGSILQNVSQDTLNALVVPLPPDYMISKFNSTIAPILDGVQNMIDENRDLASLRDFLLPMLMNGQVKVGEGA